MADKRDILSKLNTVVEKSFQEYQIKGYEGFDPAVLFKELKFYKAYEDKQTLLNKLLYATELGALYLFPDMEWYLTLIKAQKVKNNYGLSFFIQAFVKMFRYYGHERYLDEAKKLAKSVISDLVETTHGLGMANPANLNENLNGVPYTENVALIPSTAEFVFALMELYEATKDEYYLSIAHKITRSFSFDYKHKVYGDKVCLDYSTAGDHTHILNANALAINCILLVNQARGDKSQDDFIKAVYDYVSDYVLTVEIPYCGQEDAINNKNWKDCDVYHTGFTLRGMEAVSHYLGDAEMSSRLERIVSDFFPYFLNKKNEIVKMKNSGIMDIHGVAEYILCYALHIGKIPDSYLNIVLLNIEDTFDDRTFFYRKVYGKKVKCYMPRWGHAPMMNAIVSLMLGLKTSGLAFE